jgi:hypothetical protein
MAQKQDASSKVKHPAGELEGAKPDPKGRKTRASDPGSRPTKFGAKQSRMMKKPEIRLEADQKGDKKSKDQKSRPKGHRSDKKRPRGPNKEATRKQVANGAKRRKRKSTDNAILGKFIGAFNSLSAKEQWDFVCNVDQKIETFAKGRMSSAKSILDNMQKITQRLVRYQLASIVANKQLIKGKHIRLFYRNFRESRKKLDSDECDGSSVSSNSVVVQVNKGDFSNSAKARKINKVMKKWMPKTSSDDEDDAGSTESLIDSSSSSGSESVGPKVDPKNKEQEEKIDLLSIPLPKMINKVWYDRYYFDSWLFDIGYYNRQYVINNYDSDLIGSDGRHDVYLTTQMLHDNPDDMKVVRHDSIIKMKFLGTWYDVPILSRALSFTKDLYISQELATQALINANTYLSLDLKSVFYKIANCISSVSTYNYDRYDAVLVREMFADTTTFAFNYAKMLRYHNEDTDFHSSPTLESSRTDIEQRRFYYQKSQKLRIALKFAGLYLRITSVGGLLFVLVLAAKSKGLRTRTLILMTRIVASMAYLIDSVANLLLQIVLFLLNSGSFLSILLKSILSRFRLTQI